MEKLLIFGRGKYCRYKFTAVEKEYRVKGFLDNAVTDMEYDDEYGYYVYPPTCLTAEPYKEKFADCFIMCMSTSYIDMWWQLLNLGVEPDKILFSVNISPYFTELEEWLFGEGQMLVAGRQMITYVSTKGKSYDYRDMTGFKKILRDIVREVQPDVLRVASMSRIPVSRNFGAERGKAVDRYYIEKFLMLNSKLIQGTVVEVGDNTYTKRYGGDKVEKGIVFHVRGWGKDTVKGNFETGEGLCENIVDCLICTQTLQYIYDLKTAIKNIYKMLKSGGVALITVPGIKSLSRYDAENWGERWSFTIESMRQLCLEVCGEEYFVIEAFGNVKIVTAYLYGICCEELEEADFAYNDPQFPFLVTVRLHKK